MRQPQRLRKRRSAFAKRSFFTRSYLAPTIVNVVFAGNTASSGGALHIKDFTIATVANVTMMHNTVPVGNGGSAIFFEGRRNSTVSNTILWYDISAPAQNQILIPNSTTYWDKLTVQRCDVQDTPPAHVFFNNNISPPLYPLFVDPDGYDNIAATILDNNYHLQDESPCNDRGSVLLVPPDDLDLDGNPSTTAHVPFDRDGRDRYVDDPPGPYLGVLDTPNGYTEYVDIGAFEYAVGCPAATIASASPPDGTRDARQPHPPTDNSLGARQGIGSPNFYSGGPEPIDITLLNLVRGAGIVDCWQLCETGIEQVEGIPPLNPNRIISVTEQTPGVYRIFLERPNSAGHWTTIKYLGGTSYVSYASLPMEVNRDNWVTSGTDRGYLNAILNGGCQAQYSIYQWDLNHNGLCEPGYPGDTDLSRGVDLYLGNGAFIVWQGKHLPANTCPGSGAGTGAMASGGTFGEALDGSFLVKEFIAFITTLEVPEGDNPDDSFVFIDAVPQATLWLLTDVEGKELAATLEVPDLEFASKLVHDFVPDIVADIRE